ncbi:MAG: hypothetical protein HOO67_01835 [Candidatus Peribacteraceae bacterium]|nr:hypothetical protein [Candidatus Peribacteraceae bacterium]
MAKIARLLMSTANIPLPASAAPFGTDVVRDLSVVESDDLSDVVLSTIANLARAMVQVIRLTGVIISETDEKSIVREILKRFGPDVLEHSDQSGNGDKFVIQLPKDEIRQAVYSLIGQNAPERLKATA